METMHGGIGVIVPRKESRVHAGSLQDLNSVFFYHFFNYEKSASRGDNPSV